MATLREQRVAVWGGKVESRVSIAGTGDPLVFLHGETGHWDPFLDQLARRHTVYAPDFPGTTVGGHDAIKALEDLWDLTLYFEELLDALGLQTAALVGHSLGGMFAAELAAQMRSRISELVLIAPAGLWREDRPLPNWWSIPAEQLPAFTLADPHGPVGKVMFAMPQDKESALQAIIQRTWAIACASKFAWPIPEKGLVKRMHRISARTLLVWGRQDRIIPVEYAEEFASRIPSSVTLVVDRAGHIPQLEQLNVVAPAVLDFLG